MPNLHKNSCMVSNSGGQKVKKERHCPHCEKVFTNSTNYHEHLKVKHEKSAAFKCDQCHRSYGTPSRLQTHKLNVHQRVKCDECGQLVS